MPDQRVLVTGADGFVGKNLLLRLQEVGGFAVQPFLRSDDPRELPRLVADCDRVVHLAGENRPADEGDFDRVNRALTGALADAVAQAGGPRPVLFASSIHADRDTPYGRSKRAGEDALIAMAVRTSSPVAIGRFPNIFGKWSRPDYNSAIATFCYRAARGIPLEIHDPQASLTLVYIDDVVDAIVSWLGASDLPSGHSVCDARPHYTTTVGEVATMVREFAAMPERLRVDGVGQGLGRALYATFVSFLPIEKAAYPLVTHDDPRGRFVEMLRSGDSGQMSFFTAGVGVTRGGHYHHTKSEKFLVVRGRARFRFRHVLTDEQFEMETCDREPTVVDTLPGWTHDITNIGADEMIVMLWANEIFERSRPDTVARNLDLREDGGSR